MVNLLVNIFWSVNSWEGLGFPILHDWAIPNGGMQTLFYYFWNDNQIIQIFPGSNCLLNWLSYYVWSLLKKCWMCEPSILQVEYFFLMEFCFIFLNIWKLHYCVQHPALPNNQIVCGGLPKWIWGCYKRVPRGFYRAVTDCLQKPFELATAATSTR